MRIRFELLTCVVVLLISGFLPIVVAEVHVQGLAPPGYQTYSTATIGGPRTLDPHRAYDTASGALIFNVYETLIEQAKGAVDQFMAELATSWTVSPDGLTYTFTIRTGVTFSNGNPLTPSDVEYSFERAMVRDISGGPIWMFYVPIVGVFGSRYYPGIGTDAGKIALGHIIDDAFTSDATQVQIHLLTPEGFFMQILAQTWGSILDKEWMTRTVAFPGGAVGTFDWSGDWGDYKSWWLFNNLKREQQVSYFGSKITPFDNPYSMMGTGPFTFVEWIPGEGGHRTLSRRTTYWGGWPASATGTARAGKYPYPSRGQIDNWIEWQIADWTSRKIGLLTGVYDTVYVPRSNIAEVWQQADIRNRYPMEALSADALFFNFNVGDGIPGGSPFVGTETWGTGLPLTAFQDLNLRKAFMYSFNQTKFLAEQFMYEAFQCATPIIPGLAPFDRAALISYHIANRKNIDLNKAEYYFKLAWGGVDSRSGTPGVPVLPEDPTKVTPGQTWNLGFTFDMTYNTGNVPRQLSGDMLATQLLLLNNKFHMGNVPVEWALFAGDYLYSPTTNDRSIMPFYAIGWLADYADADNFVKPFQYTYGDFAFPSSYSNPAGDLLIDQASAEPDPAVRRTLYMQVNQIYLDDIPQIMGMVALGRRWERDWVQGWYYNPLFPRVDVCGNLYSIWKEQLIWADIDANGKVEIKDASAIARCLPSYYVGMLPPNGYPPTPRTPGYPNPKWGNYTKNWDCRLDVNQDMKIDIKDLCLGPARYLGWQAPPWP